MTHLPGRPPARPPWMPAVQMDREGLQHRFPPNLPNWTETQLGAAPKGTGWSHPRKGTGKGHERGLFKQKLPEAR